MYVLMFTCMCVAAEYRKEGLQKTKQRLQRNCALTMHYLKKTLKTKKKKEKKKKKHTLGQFPLPTDFTFLLFIHFRANGPTYSDKVTLPSLLLIIQTLSLKSVQWFNRHLRQAPQNTLHTLSAICRCCLLAQGFFFSCDVLN